MSIPILLLLAACAAHPPDAGGVDPPDAGEVDSADTASDLADLPALSDAFWQEPAGRVDVLLVVDDSHSMAPYQQILASSFEAFVGPLAEAGIDYRIGVTTTDAMGASAGEVAADAITPETEDAALVFQSIVDVGTEGSGTEMGLEAVRLAVEERATDFFRADAVLSVVVISDEEDSSPLSVDEYATRLSAAYSGARDAVRISVATIFQRESCNLETDEGTSGYRYLLAADETGGVSIDLCSASLPTDVARLSANATRLRRAFSLAQEPDATSIRVYVDDTEVPCGGATWTYQRVDERGQALPAVVFAEEPAPGSKIAVYYDAGSGELAACPETAPLALESQEAGTCAYHADCGPYEACVDAACTAVECLRSEDCPFGSVCGSELTCAPGCNGEADCGAGDTCEAGSCVPAACDNTLQNCGVGEVCDTSDTDTCVVPAGEWCTPCDEEAVDPCGSTALCFRWEWQDPTAAGCLPSCNPVATNPCPVGFICAQMGESGNHCLANCQDLAGYL